MAGWRGGHPSYMEGWLSIVKGWAPTGADSKGSLTNLLPCKADRISIAVRGCKTASLLKFQIL